MNEIDDPFQDTFKWVFDLPKFRHWLQKGSEMFWIYGKPGSGKSTLMKFIFQSERTWQLLHNWREGSLELKAGFFFHYRGSALQKSFEGVLRSLIAQILTPHRVAYESQHTPVWKKFQSLKQEEAKSVRQLSELERGLLRVATTIQTLTEQLAQNNSVEDAKRLGVDLAEARGREKWLRNKIKETTSSLRDARASIAKLVADFDQHSRITQLLIGVVADFNEERDGLIPKLERVLRRLLDQQVRMTDLVLFFDALDEFDGDLDLISRFLNDLVHPSTQSRSMTRVKVCFSSRPWKLLKEHFSRFPGFALQDHTKTDIELYATGRVASSGLSSRSLGQILPLVIAKADGVFLWVRLALNILIESVASGQEVSAPALQQKLQGLPADLFEFYELIIERISNSNRKKTFVLLELLIRHIGSPLSAHEIRNAVLVSECSNIGGAKPILGYELYDLSQDPEDYHVRINNDIYTWGGGLVEIQRDISKQSQPLVTQYRPQLMHQTVLEFGMGLSFKRTVVGDLAAITDENGHSFHLKYWSATTDWARSNKSATIASLRSWLERKAGTTRARYETQNGSPREKFDEEVLSHLVYHAEKSEETTGKSHFDFLYNPSPIFRGDSYDSDFVFMVASCGLSLCLRD